jgi:hypothetical protein
MCVQRPACPSCVLECGVKASACARAAAQLDIPALYRREGDAPVRALRAVLDAAPPGAPGSGAAAGGREAAGGGAGQADGAGSAEPAEQAGAPMANGGAVRASAAREVGPAADGAALRGALGGLVWTPSLRRMYTLLDRRAPAAPIFCPACTAVSSRNSTVSSESVSDFNCT